MRRPLMAIRELYWVIEDGPVWDCIACAATIRVSDSGEAKRAGGLPDQPSNAWRCRLRGP